MSHAQDRAVEREQSPPCHIWTSVNLEAEQVLLGTPAVWLSTATSKTSRFATNAKMTRDSLPPVKGPPSMDRAHWSSRWYTTSINSRSRIQLPKSISLKSNQSSNRPEETGTLSSHSWSAIQAMSSEPDFWTTAVTPRSTL